jgi:hypothetical protein
MSSVTIKLDPTFIGTFPLNENGVHIVYFHTVGRAIGISLREDKVTAVSLSASHCKDLLANHTNNQFGHKGCVDEYNDHNILLKGGPKRSLCITNDVLFGCLNTKYQKLNNFGLSSILPETQFFYGFFIFEIHIHSITRFNPVFWIGLSRFGRIGRIHPIHVHPICMRLLSCLGGVI